MSTASFVPFEQGVMGGVVTVTVFAMLSTLALASVALRILWLAVRQFITHNRTQPQEYVFFHTQLGHYAACLLIANLLSSIAGLITLDWASQRGITQGPACIAQATIMQLANWGAAYFTVTIAVHTFNSLVLRVRQSVFVCAVTITVGWVLSLMLAFIPFFLSRSNTPLYGVDGLSCGIQHIFPQDQFLFHLLPIFIASILSATLYSIIFLVLRGTLVIKGGLKLTLDPQTRWSTVGVSVNYHRFIARIARSMLWYPIAYIALLVPYSVTRMLVISGFSVPFEAKVFASTCWNLLGVVNVLLLYNTFRVLGPAFDARAGVRSDDTENPGSLKHKSSYSPAVLQSSLDEKIDQYRDLAYSIPVVHKLSAADLSEEQTPTSGVQSFYSYPSSPAIGRQFSQSALRATTASPQAYNHSRQNSVNSLGLPAPPRPSRSPIKRYPTRESVHDSVRGAWVDSELDGSFTPSAPSGQFPARVSRTSTGTVRRHVKEQSQSSNTTDSSSYHANEEHQPALSAVASTFDQASWSDASAPPLPMPVVTRSSPGAIATPIIGPVPAGRQRTVLANRSKADLGHAARVPSFSAQVHNL